MTARRAKRPPIPLSIAGSDPTAGAGVEADLITFAAHDLHGVGVATALTVQDTRETKQVNTVPVEVFRRRLDVLLADVKVDGAKTGLLPSAAHVEIAARALARRKIRRLVVDPVLAPTRGAPFLDAAGRNALLRHLLPLATLVTPNVPEAARLLGWNERRVRREPWDAAAALRALGPRAVLLKGGHGHGRESVDLLDDDGTRTAFARARLRAGRGGAHGTGCALSAAILALLLRGSALADAVSKAGDFVHRAIEGSSRLGKGRRRLDLLGAR